MMATLKTQATDISVKKFIESIEDETRRKEAFVLLDLFEKITKEKAKIWGKSIIGFGEYHYKYATGREGDWMITGFSPRKANMTLYIMPGFQKYQNLLAELGKCKTSVSCLYLNKLANVNLKVLEALIQDSVKEMKERYPNP